MLWHHDQWLPTHWNLVHSGTSKRSSQTSDGDSGARINHLMSPDPHKLETPWQLVMQIFVNWTGWCSMVQSICYKSNTRDQLNHINTVFRWCICYWTPYNGNRIRSPDSGKWYRGWVGTAHRSESADNLFCLDDRLTIVVSARTYSQYIDVHARHNFTNIIREFI